VIELGVTRADRIGKVVAGQVHADPRGERRERVDEQLEHERARRGIGAVAM
jgi:hypothetical protein